MPRIRESSDGGASADLGKGRVLMLGVDGSLSLRKTSGNLMAETFVQWSLGDCVASSQGAPREGMNSVLLRNSKCDSFH